MRTAAAALSLLFLLALEPHARAMDIEEIVKHMNATAESIKDVQASAKVTRFDSVFEETHVSARTLYFVRPHLARVDTFETRNGKLVCTQQFILGKDFTLQVWPETRHAEKHVLSPEAIDHMSRDRNDPISFFAKNIDDIRKDFKLEQIDPPKGSPAASVAVAVTPVGKDVKFDYARVEMVLDTATWLPRSIKSFVGGEKDDWTLYEFTNIKLNPGLKPDIFEAPAGIKIDVVEEDKAKN